MSRLTLGAVGLCLSLELGAANEILTFRGMVKVGSCQVVAESQAQTVELGSITTNQFNGIGTASQAREFSIKLENCVGVEVANLSMSGAVDTDNGDYFAITKTGNYAQGVAIRIRTADNQVQKPSGNVINWPKSAVDSGELKYLAEYVQTQATISGGSAHSVADFTIGYR